jgi:hypothetical protein
MSRCIECLQEMDGCEATRFMECRECRKSLKRQTPVKTIHGNGSEMAGRRERNWKVLAGSPDMEPDEPEEDECS